MLRQEGKGIYNEETCRQALVHLSLLVKSANDTFNTLTSVTALVNCCSASRLLSHGVSQTSLAHAVNFLALALLY